MVALWASAAGHFQVVIRDGPRFEMAAELGRADKADKKAKASEVGDE